MEYTSPDFISAYIVKGPQSLLPAPRVNEDTSWSAGSSATYELSDFLVDAKDMIC
jgi:hypothetical protein